MPVESLVSLGAVVDRLGSEGFEQALYGWVAGLAPVAVLFAIEVFDASRPGRVVLTEGRDEDITARARQISREYAEVDHAVDDILRAHRSRPAGQVDLLVQHGEQRDPFFRLKYYDQMGTPQEVSAFRGMDDGTLYLGASSHSHGYSQADTSALQAVFPLLMSLVSRHSALLDQHPARSRAIAAREETLRRLLHKYELRLSSREVEVCAAIVLGFRVDAIAERLTISPNTVATHRKNAYAKLRISSQTELFGILFAGWADG